MKDVKSAKTKRDEFLAKVKNTQNKAQTNSEPETKLNAENISVENADAANAQNIDENVLNQDSQNMNDTALTDQQKRDEFEKLIKGEYKDLFNERIKENLSRRFKDTDALKKQLGEAQEVVELLKSRYGLNTADIDTLKKAVNADDSYIKAEAEKRGMTVDDLKYLKKLENENIRLKRTTYEVQQQSQMQEQMSKLNAQTDEAKSAYPEFDITVESQNPKFIALLKSGVDVKTAYEVLHHNDIVSKIVNDTARETQKRTAQSMRSMEARPVENGAGEGSPAIIKSDVSKLTPQERSEIAKRVARGESITF